MTEVYNDTEPYGRVGFRNKGGQTSYYSGNCTSEDADKLDEFCQQEKISPLNTRLFKSADDKSFELKIASAEHNE